MSPMVAFVLGLTFGIPIGALVSWIARQPVDDHRDESGYVSKNIIFAIILVAAMVALGFSAYFNGKAAANVSEAHEQIVNLRAQVRDNETQMDCIQKVTEDQNEALAARGTFTEQLAEVIRGYANTQLPYLVAARNGTASVEGLDAVIKANRAEVKALRELLAQGTQKPFPVQSIVVACRN